MRIGFSGRIGVGLIVFAVVADAVSWLIRAFDDYQFDFYKQSDAYLPLVFLLGLTLLLHSIYIAFQSKRAANLAKVPLTTVGPQPPELRREAGQEESRASAARRTPVYGDEISPPRLAFVPSPSHRKLFQRLGCAFLLLAGLLYVCVQWWMATRHAFRVDRIADLLFYILAALGITLVLWPDVRETEELSLQGETRATYKGMARVGRTLQPLIALTKPLSSLRAFSYFVVVVLAMVWWFEPILSPLTPRGLMVHVPKPGTYAHVDEPWNEPLVLRIDAQGKWYLNLQPVPRADMGERLLQALRLRADWTVFLDADPNVGAGNVIEAADIIRGTGDAKVFLVTPSMKTEKPVLAAKPPCEIETLQEPQLRLPPEWRGNWYGRYPLVSFDVSERGEVLNVKIQEKGDLPGLDEWVVHSVWKWKFTPTPGCGKPLLEMYAQISPY